MGKSKKRLAQKYCANWKYGNCLGSVHTFDRETGTNTVTIDEKLADKPCIVDEGCYYFEDYVAPALNDATPS